MYNEDVLRELMKFSTYDFDGGGNLYSSVDMGVYDDDEEEQKDDYIDTQGIF
jgi:hypothetical protein